MSDYSIPYKIKPSDIDANGHVNYAVYIDAAGDMRYRFFSENGFPPEMFVQLGIGPVYTDIHARLLREVLIGETITITCSLSGLSPLGARWKVHHDFIKSNGKKAVSLDIEGVILDLKARKPVTPTPHLLQTFNLLPHSPYFETLPETHRPK